MDSPGKLEQLLADNRDRLKEMVTLRLDPRVQARVDASDVVQEAYIEATERFSEYLSQPTCPEFVWLRFLTLQKVAQLHRTHLGVKARSVMRERQFVEPNLSASSIMMAQKFATSDIGPLSAVKLAEQKDQLIAALNSLKESDQEMIALRHFEMLSNQEAAQVLGINDDTAYRRYIRALSRLKQLLAQDGNASGVL